ncbi:hypothetical protein VE00_08325 [Pseudogymnoascus sp. WSF 3629]|nr:hypothetical protein VE00_08325 [Pseudogymnoascus sp. WSF 3629]
MTRHVASCQPPRATSKRRRNPDDLYQDVLLQSWGSGACRKYWIVHQAATNDALRIFSSSSHLEAMHEREREHIAAYNRAAKQERGSKELELTGLWMERTQWAQIYDGARRDLLVRISQMERQPAWARGGGFSIGEHQGVQIISRKADEKKIRQLMMALDRALDRCEDTMHRTGHSILCWLNSGSRNRFYQKPFSFLGRAATRQRYGRLFQRIIPFLFRAFNMTAAARKSALEIRFTTKQSKELRRVWNDDAWAEEDRHIGNADDKDQACLNSGNIWETEEDDNSGDEYKNEGDEDEYNSEEDEEKDDTSDESEIEGGEEGCMTHPENKDEDKNKDSEVSYEREGQYILTPKVDKLAEIIFRLSVFLATEQFTNGQPSLIRVRAGYVGSPICSRFGRIILNWNDMRARSWPSSGYFGIETNNELVKNTDSILHGIYGIMLRDGLFLCPTHFSKLG